MVVLFFSGLDVVALYIDYNVVEMGVVSLLASCAAVDEELLDCVTAAGGWSSGSSRLRAPWWSSVMSGSAIGLVNTTTR